MGILPDWKIRELCLKGMVEPFDPQMINPASLDIRIGYSLKLRVPTPEKWQLFDLKNYTAERPFMMQPNDRILVASLEMFHIPIDVCADFKLKSTRGREFYQHLKAGFCDPGWHDSLLTMELINLDPYDALPLYPGFRIGQMVFDRMESPPELSYAETGRYNGDLMVQESKG